MIDVLCKHGVIADWCGYCKHGDKGPDRSLKVILREENLAIVENFSTWPRQVNRTTSR